MPKQLDVKGVEISVEDRGDGFPVVLVHGWSMSGRFFDRQLAGLSGSYRVVVPDLRGHGRSEKVLSGHTVPQYAHDLREALALLGVERPLLLGWSMGAMVALEFLRAFGAESVAGLVHVDQPPSDFAWDGYEFGVFTMPMLAETVEALQLDQRAVAEEFAGLMLHEPDPETTAWMTEEILRVPPAVAATILVDQTLRDYRAFLREVSVPTLVLFGEDDKLTSPKAGELIASEIPGARFRSFPASSHCPFWEEADDFNAVVDEFARSLG